MNINLEKFSAPLYYLVRLLSLTLRKTLHQQDIAERIYTKERQLILACWHDELFCMPMLIRKASDIICVVSASKDGEVLSNILGRYGLRCMRGSSHRSGLRALLSAVHLMRTERVHTVISVDGPTGPRHKTKDGAFLLAQKADALIMPVRVVPSPRMTVDSWDRFQIPLPFGKVDFYFGEPWAVGSDKLDEDALAVLRERLETDLHNLAPHRI